MVGLDSPDLSKEEVIDRVAQAMFRLLDGSEWEGCGESSKERYRRAAAIVTPELPFIPELPPRRY